MKLISLTIALFVGLLPVDEKMCNAINVIENNGQNSVKTKKNGKKMISVALNQMEYENRRYKDYIKPLSNASNFALA